MSTVLIAYMGIATAAVLVGVALSGLLGKSPRMGRFAIALSAGVMLAVCLLYLIPDALAFQHGLVVERDPLNNHLSIGYGLSLGFLSLLTVERYLLHDHRHGHDHDYGQTHRHDTLQKQREIGVAWSTVGALSLHGLFDGVALHAAGMMPVMGPALATAIILHKVPEAAALFTVLRRGQVTPRSRRTALFLYLLATPLGMLLSLKLLALFSERGVAMLMAFVAGSLLHLVTGHLLPEATAPGDDDAGQRGTFAVMLGGFFVLLLARVLGPG